MITIINPKNNRIDNKNIIIKNTMDKHYKDLKKGLRESQMSSDKDKDKDMKITKKFIFIKINIIIKMIIII